MRKLLIAAFATIFLFHQWLEYMGVHYSFADAYLDDFLFLPLFLFTIEVMLSVASRQRFRLSPTQELVLCLQAVITAEFIFPLYSDRFVFDYWDFAAYASGYMVYRLMLAIFRHDKVKTA